MERGDEADAKAGKAALTKCKAIAAKITVADVIEARAAAGMPDMTEAETKAAAGRIETLKAEDVTETPDMDSPAVTETKPQKARCVADRVTAIPAKTKARTKEEKAQTNL
jgi:hypothetical protein